MTFKDYRKEYNSFDATRLYLYALIFPYLGIFVLYMVYSIIGSSIGTTPKELFESLPVAMFNAIFMQLCFVAVFFIFNHKRKINFITGTKLNKKFNPYALAVALCLGFAVMWFSSPLVTLLEEGLKAIGFKIDSDLGFKLDNAGTIIFALLFIGLMPAFIEEFIFRGAILQGLRKHGDWFAIIASALLFMLMHGNLQQSFYQFGFGLLAGWIVIKTGSIWVSVAMHALNNCSILVMSSINDCNGVVSVVKLDTAFAIKAVIYTIVLAFLVWLGIYLLRKICKNQEVESQLQQQEIVAKPKTRAEQHKLKKNKKQPQPPKSKFMRGCYDYFSDKYRKRESIGAIFLSLCMIIVNSVAMLM